MKLSDGSELATDLVVFSAGVRPRDQLARDCGLTVGERGGIKGARALGIGIARLAQRVPGEVADDLDQRHQTLLRRLREGIADRQPVGGAGLGVGRAELEALGGPGEGGAQRLQRIGAGLLQA